MSSRHGAVADGRGLDLDEVLALRAEHGSLFVAHLEGLELHRADELLGLAVDVLVTAGSVGAVDAEVATAVQAKVVAPATGVPYTGEGIDRLRRVHATPLPDFVTTAGPLLAATAPRGLARGEVLGRIERLVTERIDAARRAKIDPFRYCAMLADTFLTTWVPADERPNGPALLAPAPLP